MQLPRDHDEVAALIKRVGGMFGAAFTARPNAGIGGMEFVADAHDLRHGHMVKPAVRAICQACVLAVESAAVFTRPLGTPGYPTAYVVAVPTFEAGVIGGVIGMVVYCRDEQHREQCIAALLE